jgi:septal ring factor EnvC (AmiA/AmiB activator)
MLLAAASAPVGPEAQPVDVELKQARAEARAAEADMRRLDQAAAKARDETAKLAAERRAAALAITAAEARISAADAEARLAEARVAQKAAQLSKQQAPLAALLAGIVTMGRRPPLLSSADSSSLDEFVRVRALLDTTLPVIRRRSEVLSAQLAESRRLQASASRAGEGLQAARKELASRQQRFAALEARAAERAASLGAGAVGASDVLVASTESEARLRSEAQRRRDELKLAAELGTLAAAPARPDKARPVPPPLAYRLPVAASVVEGVGSISDTGIRARGLTLQAYAGQQMFAPADGIIAFAGAFRRHDGVVIIDHGRGWMTLMTGVRTDLRKGQRIRLGQPLGRALGPVTVELSANGSPFSAALIAGSSQLLSIKGKSG